MINKSATRIGVVGFSNGNRVELHHGINRNTGAPIIWQQLRGGRPSRVTGRNLVRLLDELDEVLCEGEAVWVGEHRQDVLDALCDQVNFVPRSARVS